MFGFSLIRYGLLAEGVGLDVFVNQAAARARHADAPAGRMPQRLNPPRVRVLFVSASTWDPWRAQAEKRLQQAIGDGELSFVPLRSRRKRPGSGRRAGVVEPVLGNGAAA